MQLYARALHSGVPMPLKQLWAFERVWLEAGQQRRLTYRLTPGEALSHYDAERRGFALEPGEYAVEAGASSRDIRLSGRFRVQ